MGPIQIGWNPAGGPWLLDGIDPRRWNLPRAQPGRLLPLAPEAAGFAGNTALAAAILWSGLFGWRDLRRALRRRRGACPNCAYPMDDLNTCPECGGTTGRAAATSRMGKEQMAELTPGGEP